MKVRDAMHKDVMWRSPTTLLSEIARLMQREGIGSVPIGENDRLVGMVTDRDIAIRGVARGEDLSSKTARDVMSAGLTYCRDDEDMNDAIERMEKRRIRRLPVINAENRLVGILSLGDVSQATSPAKAGGLLQAVSAHH